MLAKLMEYVEQSFSITVTVIFLVIFSSGAGFAMVTFNSLNDSQSEKARMLEFSKFSSYNGGTVTGDRVISAARKFSREPEFYIYVRNGVNGAGVDVAGNGSMCPFVNSSMVSYTPTYALCTYKTSDLQDETSSAYVKLTDVYKSMLVTDGHGAVTGLYFEKL